ncbi:MAG: GGDEF domain-containing protein [Rhizobiales bacterium]|jgi:diguanylate cyclase (GGDEF)-like protein|nr:GGDEF domain-containing protein [Hyphomicrobiales bacterium]
MQTAATSLSSLFAAPPADNEKRSSLGARRRRVRIRRQMIGYICISYFVDALLLSVYAATGAISWVIAPAYLTCGIGSALGFGILYETRLGKRYDDSFLVIPQAVVGLLIMLVFAWHAPQAGFLFLCNLFIVFSFSSLRASARETAVVWTAMAIGLLVLFLGANKQIGLPLETFPDRVATMIAFALTIGRCMFIGIFSNSLRESLYNKSRQLKEAYRRIEELAELDELTGSFNRRCIMRMLDDEVARAQRSKTPCAVALIDLDWFKRINDSHGHPIGDEVLRTFAITVFANIRGIDRFGRYGGEEFLLIMPETSATAAASILDRLRLIVAELDWSAFSSGMAVTISAGVAELSPTETPDALLARADEALYAAKEAGRNQVASA